MNGRYLVSHRVVALAAMVALPGCMQSRVDESRELHTHIQKSEAVVILPKPQGDWGQSSRGSCDPGGLGGQNSPVVSVLRRSAFRFSRRQAMRKRSLRSSA